MNDRAVLETLDGGVAGTLDRLFAEDLWPAPVLALTPVTLCPARMYAYFSPVLFRHKGEAPTSQMKTPAFLCFQKVLLQKISKLQKITKVDFHLLKNTCRGRVC